MSQSDITIGADINYTLTKTVQLNNHYDIQIESNANINIQVDKGNLNLVVKDETVKYQCRW